MLWGNAIVLSNGLTPQAISTESPPTTVTVPDWDPGNETSNREGLKGWRWPRLPREMSQFNLKIVVGEDVE